MLTDTELSRFLFSILVLLLAAHGFGYVFERLRLPRVIGEICGGLVLGQTAIGLFEPEIAAWSGGAGDLNAKLLSAVYWMGLILLMFTAGFRLQRGFGGDDRRLAAVLLLAATVIPFSSGLVVTQVVDLSGYMGPNGTSITLALVFSIAVAVTSIPVISRIFMDLGLIETRFAKVVLAASTVQDVILWSALAVAISLAGAATVTATDTVLTALQTVLFVVVAAVLGPIILQWVNRLRLRFFIQVSRIGYALAWCLLMVFSHPPSK
jgi:Kef-type K+ transport system membrane component KefB